MGSRSDYRSYTLISMSIPRIVPEESWLRSDSRMSSTEQTKVFKQIGIPQEVHVCVVCVGACDCECVCVCGGGRV